MKKKKSKNGFPYDLDFSVVNFRQQPELYRIGRGEQGVLLVQPIKKGNSPLYDSGYPSIVNYL